jgi:centromere protein C
MRAPTTPMNGRTSRPVARTSSVDFDKIPSPRNNSRSLSMVNRAGPSKLRRSMIPEDREPSSEPGEQFQGDDSGEMDMTMTLSVAQTNMSVGVARERQDSMYGAPTTVGRNSSPLQNSFTQMDQDDDDDDEHFPFIEPEALPEPTPEPEPEDPEPTPPPEPPKKGKGKARDPSPQVQEQEWGMEEDIAQGLQELDQNQPSDGDEPEPEPEPKKKKLKVKLADQEPPSKTRTKSANKKENRRV